ncbi:MULTISPECIES: aspartate aminotransferase family protein [Calditerrivibrio]|jgi:glutamate-1-semialdehyde 2,1-aminomutase|uniref:Aspartate aminotransferase family protein n=1 Tax=Calditerrivibrio nitroreducens TaxID=477976 RepID=A0A2J6WP10_9BACT|nr:MAG: hypothetical protein C0187_02290 [Calditerrivibrio nitroreducens]
MNYFDIYSKRFKSSGDIFDRFKNSFPKGVSHDIRFFAPFPFVVERAYGSKILTIDGIELIDMWMGHYANILGHTNRDIVEEIYRVSKEGVQIGILNRYQLQLAEKIRDAVPEMEMMRFCTSGTEATMYATRISKKFTRRGVIAKIEGGWHGGNTDLSFDVKPPYSRIKNDVLSIPYNDLETSLEILHSHKDKVAAVILEPVLGAGGGVAAEVDFLRGIRRFCDEDGSLLIFDETITGFRFRFGSTWPIFGVKPDLFTMGKIIGGGFAIGVYGGRKDVMQIIEKGDIITGGGTFSEHPVTMAAGLKTLELLEKHDYNHLNLMGEKLRENISSLLNEDSNIIVSGFGSMTALHFHKSFDDVDSKRPSTFLTKIDSDRESLFKILMILNGVFTMHSGGCLTFAHSDEDFRNILAAYKKSLEQLYNG